MDAQAAAEIRAERDAFVSSVFLKLKTWYEGETSEAVEVAKQYGDFPKFKREAAEWPHFKLVHKVYEKCRA